MPLTGDFQTLDRWERQLGALESPRLMFEVADAMADATLGFIAEGFGRESDPFGKRWAPKKRPDGRPILQGKTGKLRRFRKGSVNQNGFRVDPGSDVFKFHQHGTSRMVARRMVPNGRLPPRWASEYREIYVRAMRSRLSAITGGGGGTRIRLPRSRAA